MKLTARGRTILAKVSITQDREVTFGEPGETVSVRTELVLLSDGVIGIKHSFLNADGKLNHSAGWKVKAKLKANLRERVTANIRRDEAVQLWTDAHVKQGYEVTT